MSERDIFLAILDIPDPAKRVAYLDQACGTDAALRVRVEGLLSSHGPTGSFLACPGPDAGPTRTDGDAHAEDHEDALALLGPPSRPGALGRLRHYEVLEVLGRGGFGIVFRAVDDKLQRMVALKVLAPSLATTPQARQRFLREARSAAAVRHENVVQVYEVEEQPLPHLVMELFSGETLQQRLDRAGPLEVAEVLRVGRQVAEGLAAAHEKRLIHRDIKPSNILLDARQKVKITDFGLARAADDASLTRSGVVAGTPMYMAPEQARGETLDQRADLFSLGSVLYTMLAGRPPFRAENTPAVLKRVCEDTPQSIRELAPRVPQWLCRIAEKLLAKDVAERFQTAREVADVLADCEQQIKAHGDVRDFSRIPGSPPGAWPVGRWIWAASALALLPLLVWGGYALTPPWPAPVPKDQAESDLEHLKGDWAVHVGELDGKPLPLEEIESLEIRLGRRDFEFRSKGKAVKELSGTFKVEAAKKQLLLFPAGQVVPVRVAYRLNGGRLRLDFAGLLDSDKREGRKPLRIAERSNSRNNLNQLAHAVLNYQDAHKSLPPAAVMSGKDNTGTPLLSWRVLTLPYIEQEALFKKFKLDEPWDSEHNRKLIPMMPKIFQTPGITTPKPGMTHYRAFVGPGTAFESRPGRAGGVRLHEIQDGTSNTLLIAEASEPVIWTNPEGLPYGPKTPLAKLGVYETGANLVFCDLSVRTLAPNASEAAVRALITRNGGEFVSAPFLSPEPPQAPPLYLELRRRER